MRQVDFMLPVSDVLKCSSNIVLDHLFCIHIIGVDATESVLTTAEINDRRDRGRWREMMIDRLIQWRGRMLFLELLQNTNQRALWRNMDSYPA